MSKVEEEGVRSLPHGQCRRWIRHTWPQKRSLKTFRDVCGAWRWRIACANPHLLLQSTTKACSKLSVPVGYDWCLVRVSKRLSHCCKSSLFAWDGAVRWREQHRGLQKPCSNVSAAPCCVFIWETGNTAVVCVFACSVDPFVPLRLYRWTARTARPDTESGFMIIRRDVG